MTQNDDLRTAQAKLGANVAATNADGTDTLPTPTVVIVDAAGRSAGSTYTRTSTWWLEREFAQNWMLGARRLRPLHAPQPRNNRRSGALLKWGGTRVGYAL